MSAENKLFLVRHLKTEYNSSGINMGRLLDAEILQDTETISEFKQKVKNVVKTYGLSSRNIKLISSPLKRCRQTADLIRDTLGFREELLILNDLIETDMGDFSGKKASQLREKYGELIDQWMFRPSTFQFPQGESYRDVQLRVANALEKIRTLMEDGKTLFVCSHVDIIKMAILLTLGTSFDFRRKLIIPNGSISVLGLSDESLRIEGLNVIS